ncbi:alpha/beta fold hydrolase (plasmid) [Paracoccus liaowanqingii]|uniref:Alpha/beta fold hydrolase n=1 Tax=Paracoccus liaowanqingii TaxID=2560053 RepID=A0A4Y5SW00_9RHOB|nr:alpha/beta hydrolase [Paracoccus liaowanqingii]QDA36944.1 alpha/beta fold hydrolase [Paracoccus liaowanqingii]
MSRTVQTGFAHAADGIGLHWRHYPAERPRARVVLIHALAMDGSTWAGVIDALPEEVSAITVDCRGHGISDTGTDDFTLTQFADDIVAVLDAAGWERAVIAGCSMGGCVAQAVAAHHPYRTAGLVLIDTTASYGPDASANWAARADKAGASGLESLLPFQRERWFSDAFRAGQPDRVAETEAVFLRNDLSAYVRSCTMLGRADLRCVLAGLCVPAAVLVGSDDRATTPDMARDLVAAIPGATLQVLEGARHFTPIERPAAIAQAITTIADRSGQVLP